MIMRETTRRWTTLGMLWACAACGSDGGSDDSPDAGAPDAAAVDAAATALPEVPPGQDIPIAEALADGQVIAPWDAYCVATFTRDFEVTGAGGSPAFTIQAGDRYLLGKDDFVSDGVIVYIADGGAASFRLDFGGHAQPYTSSCGSAGRERISVFADTVLFSDPALATPVCTLEAGQLMPAAAYSFSLADNGYEVQLDGLARLCSGATRGYVKPLTVDVGSLTVRGLPFIGVRVP